VTGRFGELLFGREFSEAIPSEQTHEENFILASSNSFSSLFTTSAAGIISLIRSELCLAVVDHSTTKSEQTVHHEVVRDGQVWGASFWEGV